MLSLDRTSVSQMTRKTVVPYYQLITYKKRSNKKGGNHDGQKWMPFLRVGSQRHVKKCKEMYGIRHIQSGFRGI